MTKFAIDPTTEFPYPSAFLSYAPDVDGTGYVDLYVGNKYVGTCLVVYPDSADFEDTLDWMSEDTQEDPSIILSGSVVALGSLNELETISVPELLTKHSAFVPDSDGSYEVGKYDLFYTPSGWVFEHYGGNCRIILGYTVTEKQIDLLEKISLELF